MGRPAMAGLKKKVMKWRAWMKDRKWRMDTYMQIIRCLRGLYRSCLKREDRQLLGVQGLQGGLQCGQTKRKRSSKNLPAVGRQRGFRGTRRSRCCLNIYI